MLFVTLLETKCTDYEESSSFSKGDEAMPISTSILSQATLSISISPQEQKKNSCFS